MKKELFIFLTLMIVLALGMHFNQWISHPIEHLEQLSHHKMPYHPLLYTAFLYIILGAFRGFFFLAKSIFRRK